MLHYLDASVIVPLFLNEIHSQAVRDFMADHASECLLSQWTVIESVSAFVLAHRRGSISLALRDQMIDQYHRLLDALRPPLELADEDFQAARKLLTTEQFKLRLGDALHLGIVVGLADTMLVTTGCYAMLRGRYISRY